MMIFCTAIGIKTGVGKNYTQSELNNKVSDSANKTAVINFVKKNKGNQMQKLQIKMVQHLLQD